ncbi:MAG: hypothetical protein HY282_09735 [Nitrospirae bacterium]|nr:hypothetical protein [Candidatus Manganitrophaceae bacterium]
MMDEDAHCRGTESGKNAVPIYQIRQNESSHLSVPKRRPHRYPPHYRTVNKHFGSLSSNSPRLLLLLTNILVSKNTNQFRLDKLVEIEEYWGLLIEDEERVCLLHIASQAN